MPTVFYTTASSIREAGGFIDKEKEIPASPNSMFHIASMTKGLTAMAILKLRDDNLLRLDDPAHLYIPVLKEQSLTSDSPDITLRDLLTHAAGLPKQKKKCASKVFA
jgi:CubicO group peptidase (beta-lactamase class C family)